MSDRNYIYLDEPSTGGYLTYEAIIYPGNVGLSDSFSFGFCSGVSEILSFTGISGKFYDNDGNYIYSYRPDGDPAESPFEVYGNVFNDRHNYSIDRVPVNMNCSKVVGDYIDSFFYENDGFLYGLSVDTIGDGPSIDYD